MRAAKIAITGAPIKSAADYAAAMAAQERLEMQEQMQQAGIDPSVIDRAIANGIEEGMFSAYAAKIEQIGDCYHEPEDRCVMRPQDGYTSFVDWPRFTWSFGFTSV